MKSKRIFFSLVIALMLIIGTLVVSRKASNHQQNLALSRVSAFSDSSNSSATQPDAQIDATAELSTNIIRDYLNAKANTTSLSTAQSQDIGMKAVQNVIDNNSQPENFIIKPISTFPDTDVQKLKDFASNFASIQDKYEKLYSANELPTIDADFIQTPNGQSQLKKVGVLYKSMAEDLENISVPASQISIYNSLIQIYLNYAQNFELMGNTNNDPTGGIIGLSRQIDIWETDLDVIQQLADFLSEKKII